MTKTKLQYLKSLSRKKIRERDGVFIVEGWRSMEEACGAVKGIEILVHTKEARENKKFSSVFSSAKRIAKETFEISGKELSLIADTTTSQGIAAVVKKLSADADREIGKLLNHENAFVVALDRVGDPGNVGSIIRTCDWFGIDAIFIGDNSVELGNPKVVRSTMGSLFHLPIVELGDAADSLAGALRKLRNAGFRLYGAEVSGNTDVRSLTWSSKSALVIGNEAHGISTEIAKILDERVAVPKFGKAESLNAGVATAVLLAHRALHQKK